MPPVLDTAQFLRRSRHPSQFTEPESLLRSSSVPATCHIPSQINPVYTISPYSFRIHFRFILGYQSRLLLQVSHQNSVCVSLLHTCHMTCQSQPTWFSDPNNLAPQTVRMFTWTQQQQAYHQRTISVPSADSHWFRQTVNLTLSCYTHAYTRQ